MSATDVALHHSQSPEKRSDIVVLTVIAVFVAVVVVCREVIGGAFAFPPLMPDRAQGNCRRTNNTHHSERRDQGQFAFRPSETKMIIKKMPIKSLQTSLGSSERERPFQVPFADAADD